MNIETLIYAYLAICASMIVFNCVCVFAFQGRDRMLRTRSVRLEEQVAEQLGRIRAGEAVTEEHRAFLRKKLARTNQLMAFDEAMDRLMEEEPEETKAYLEEISPVFNELALKNHYRSVEKITYFAYIIKKYRVIQGKPAGAALGAMMSLLNQPGLHCRENALRAIYSSGNCRFVVQALQIVDENGIFHHAKLLTDGLLTFAGEKQQLAQALWAVFDQFSPQMQVVILDYIRFGGVDMSRELLALLADSQADDELRFSCIRYFGKYPCEQAFPLLLAFAKYPERNRWEYAAIAVSALASYPGQRTVQVLKRSLSSPNWYVRFNAARSLEGFHLSYLELSDVLDGQDRYAREILQYQMDLENARRGREAALV